jgi:hypothetical protein
MWFEGDVESLSQTLGRAHEFYWRQANAVSQLGESVRHLYSEEAVYGELRNLLPNVLSGDGWGS